MTTGPLKISEATAASALDGTEQIPALQASAAVKLTPAQIKTYMQALFQPIDTDLTAVAALASTGLAAHTAAGTWAERTITGTSNEVDIADGGGVSGNPTASLSSTMVLPGTLTLGGTLTITGYEIQSGGNAVIQVGDNAGTYKISLQDSDSAEVFAVDSSGNLTLSGTVDGRDIAADGTTLDGTLTSISALGTAADKMAYTTGIATWAETAITSFARSILDDTNEATFKATVNLEIGTDVQAQNANLQAVADLTSAADKLPYFTGSGTAALADLTSAGRALIDDASASAQRTTLGVDTVVIPFVIDGGGAAITTGIKGDLEIPFACTLTQNTLLADQSGSIVIDIWVDSYANFPPTVADTITASAKPTLSTATKSQDATLTGWTTSIAAGSILRFNVDSASTVQRVTLSITATRA